ncbi:MAG TPA: PadR family transcriptional regulator [Solirubrobacteraceae bacterium]|jgi:DNA-binding PadR family transcriptional regulator|nr:PadR family transcriptional regulator [Solirubrobacteraceae bacterium]
MPQRKPSEESRSRERTPLRTAVLAALLQHEEGYGYDMTSRINRTRPEWGEITRNRVYATLEEFEADGLVWSDYRKGPGKRGRERRVYWPTPRAEELRSAWIGECPSLEEMRSDIRTWVAFARPRDAPEVLRKLEEYELGCLEMLESLEEPGSEPRGWEDRAINVLRYGTAEELNAELRWITRARREVKEFLAQ